MLFLFLLLLWKMQNSQINRKNQSYVRHDSQQIFSSLGTQIHIGILKVPRGLCFCFLWFCYLIRLHPAVFMFWNVWSYAFWGAVDFIFNISLLFLFKSTSFCDSFSMCMLVSRLTVTRLSAVGANYTGTSRVAESCFQGHTWRNNFVGKMLSRSSKWINILI